MITTIREFLLKEDIYYPKEYDNTEEYKKIPTDRQVEHLQQFLETFLDEQNIADEFTITSITYFNWNNKPKWFVFLVNGDWFQKRARRERDKKIVNGEDIKKFGIKGERELHSKYIELTMDPIWVNVDMLEADNIEIAGHGYPAHSEEIWRLNEENY